MRLALITFVEQSRRIVEPQTHIASNHDYVVSAISQTRHAQPVQVPNAGQRRDALFLCFAEMISARSQLIRSGDH